MYPAPFEYIRAESWEHALDVLAQHGAEARPLAGGQSLVPLMKLRLAQPRLVVDIGHLACGAAQTDEAGLRVPALIRHAAAEREPLLGLATNLLWDAACQIGDPQIRHMGTVGGALAEADPSGDWSAAFIALRAEVVCRSRRGERTIPLRAFFQGPYATALAPDELIAEVRIPHRPKGGRSGGAYLKVEWRAGSFAVAGVAVELVLDDERRCRDIGIGLAALGPCPAADEAVEAVLRGRPITDDAVAEARTLLGRRLEPYSDTRASAEYRRALGPVVFERALRIAAQRALGSEVEARVW